MKRESAANAVSEPDQAGMTRDIARVITAEDTILLLTHQKAGTHWLRYFFANYVRLLANPDTSEAVSYRELQDELEPNRPSYIIVGRRAYTDPDPRWGSIGFRDFMFDHVGKQLHPAHLFLGPRILLHRNPLDYLISIFFYNYEYRKASAGRYSHPREVMNRELAGYCAAYKQLVRLRTDTARDYWISYESLWRDPSAQFSSMVQWVAGKVDEAALARAVDYSDVTVVRRSEEARGKAIVADLVGGYFTRDGSIGQWRKWLTSEDVDRARSILDEAGLSLESFDLG